MARNPTAGNGAAARSPATQSVARPGLQSGGTGITVEASEPGLLGLRHKVGNRGMQALLAARAASVEPPDADLQRRAMGARFGMSFADVTLRVDAQAQRTAQASRAGAYTDGKQIGFGAGAYDPASGAGRDRIAHEFAHVAQMRGGNAGGTLPAVATRSLAEQQASRAVASVAAGYRPRVSAFAGGGLLFDDGKTGKALGIQFSNDDEALKIVMNMLDTLPIGEQRRGAITMLVALAMKPGTAQGKATQRLFEALAGLPTKNFDDHMGAVNELKYWTAKDVRAYDLLLYGRYWFADHSKSDLGSGLSLDAFRNYLHYQGGNWAVTFFEKRIIGSDKFKAQLAARVVVDLLEGAGEPSEAKYAANYMALRTMARRNGLESHGALGAASATPRVFSALGAIREQADKVRRLVEFGPINDQWENQDLARLQSFVTSLGMQGTLRDTTPGKTPILLFTAENREESEHELLKQDADNSSVWLQEMARTYTIAADAGVKLVAHTQVLHDNAHALDQFLGLGPAAASDERQSLFDLRHEYIEAWMSAFGNPFGADSNGMAVDYQSKLDDVEWKFEHFDMVIAARKKDKVVDRYRKFTEMWEEGNKRYPGNNGLDESFFFTMRSQLTHQKESLDSAFDVKKLSFSVGTIVGNMGYTTTTTPSSAGLPNDLSTIAHLEMQTSIFGLEAALFLIYATSLSIHSAMVRADIGSKDFRTVNGNRLAAMRTEMEDFWNKGNYDAFLGKVDGYEATLKEVLDKIKDRAKLDLLLNLAITLVAALVTEGAALAVRFAALSETLAIARTARALSSMSTLVEVGVFSTTELSLQKLTFGKDIGAVDVVRSVGTNLAFVGVLKAVGKFAEPFAQGSTVRQLLIGHLAGFTGVAVVSATMQRIQTGEWPPDIAAFLVQTAVTYLLIAGMHHAFQELAAKPILKGAATARLESLDVANKAMMDSYRGKVDSGTLKPAEFEGMRAERIRLIEEARAIGKVLHDGGVMTKADMDAVNKMADNALADASGAIFPLDASSGLADPVKALPALDSIIDLTRVGDSDTYVYDPSKPRTGIDAMLARYKDKGFKVQGNDSLMRIVDPSGNTRFLLTAAPLANARFLLPATSNAIAPAPGTLLERATGLVEPAVSNARAALANISPQAEGKLPLEYEDHTALATIAMLIEQQSLIKDPWPIDSVRGLADAMKLENGIPRSAIRRLFATIDPKLLPGMFGAYHDIAISPKVSSGTRFLIADDLIPRNSVKLIEGYRQLQKAGIDLPPDMNLDIRAVRGLLKRMEQQGGVPWLTWLKSVAVEKRAEQLRALSGLVDPTVHLPENVVQLLSAITADIPGNVGISPLMGANGEAFVAAIEAKSAGTRFATPQLRFDFVRKVDDMRMDVAKLQQGKPLVHGNWEQVVGRANEVRQVASIMLTGSTIQVADKDVGPKGPLPTVDLSTFALPGGGKIVNAPISMDVHLDLLYVEPGGTLVATELSTAELSLPEPFSALDPKNAAYGTNIDWALGDKGIATHRKFMQILKIYQLNQMATTLGGAWSGGKANPTSMRVRAGDFTAAAARAIENLGFVLERNDGTRETAAQVAARKKSK